MLIYNGLPCRRDRQNPDPKVGFKLFLMCGIMVFSRLCGVTQYSYYMVDIITNAGVTDVPAEWVSAGITIFEILGKSLVLLIINMGHQTPH